MERYQIILAYDGTDFQGSQFQKDARTVQGVVESSLRKLNWAGKSVLMAGRTDAGVHAAAQVAAFDLEWKHSLVDLRNALNALLPEDVSVSQVLVRSPEFHPRFDAISRTYRYSLYTQEMRDPLLDRYAWRVWPKPDLDRLNSAASLFLGIHDFAGYGRPTRGGGSTIRNIMSIAWEMNADCFTLRVTGNAFLYHMVRRLTFAQVMAARNSLEFEELSQYLNNPKGKMIKGLAPAKGLTLIQVNYSESLGRID